MKLKLIVLLFTIYTSQLWAQQKTSPSPLEKQRLDFAKMYFEGGGTFLPSFTGKHLVNGQLSSFEHSATLNPYLTWGAFHFWGHTEFYVTFPFNQLNLNKNNTISHQLLHSVATGARIYPWTMKEGKIRPYIGANGVH